ncbi:O-antigen ligase family protein [Bacteroides faecium]|uniref:O-antigen ligase family protein n=1 Tax=Bacteroides faecium TaxID=2715212 RepID=A0A6H0KW04_9BACE|nr:O-antigen ligase family protein [Bacteroides faecium]QIU97333.1 O-antigen ligase family protein [Bacteroides faecium]
MKTIYATTTLIGIIFMCTTINVIGGIHNIPSSSILFSITTIAIGIGVLCTFFIRQKTVFKFTCTDLFMVVLTISYLVYHLPLSGNRELGTGSLFFIYWCIRYTGKLNYSLIFYFILVSITLLLITCYSQYIGLTPSNSPYFRITGPYQNPAICAGVLSLLMSILTVWLIYSHYHTCHHRTIRIIVFVLFITSIPILIMTNCRSAWLGFIVMIVYSISSYRYRKQKKTMKHRFRKNFKYWLAGIMLLLFLIYGLYQLKPMSANGRLLIWKVTAQMIRDKPLIGYGAEGFKQHYMHYQAAYLKTKGTEQERYIAGNNHLAYNEPLRMTVEYGFLGVIIYIWFIYIIFKAPLHTTIASASARAVLITGTVWGLFSYPNEAFSILVILLIAILCLSIHNKTFLYTISTAYIHKGFKVILTVIFCYLSIILFNQYKAQHTFYKIHQSTKSSNLESFIYNCSILENNFKNEVFFWMYYCDALNEMKYDQTLQSKIQNWERLYPSPETYIIKAESLERIGQEKEAEKLYWLAHFMVPSRQKARSKLAILYKKQGKMKEALELANEILTEKVKNYSFETYRIHTTLERIFENRIK